MSQGREPYIVLVVEDNRADVMLIEEALVEAGVPAKLHVVSDGESALAFIERADASDDAICPQLLLLDLNIPKKSGTEILDRVRRSTKCGNIPVIVVTSSDSPQDRELTSRLGATRYFRKPTDYDEYMKVGVIVREVLEGTGV